MSSPPAYLLTWTTYGTWLHGDERGSVDDAHNSPNDDYAPPDLQRRALEATRQNTATVTLNGAARRVVTQAIEDHCRIRRWDLIALNVRSNHVHAVVYCGDERPEVAVGQLKSWATRRLRAAGLFEARFRIWTRQASTRYLWNDESIRQAGVYVVERQGDDLN
jgi:REP element-mobilizing transposase RayT